MRLYIVYTNTRRMSVQLAWLVTLPRLGAHSYARTSVIVMSVDVTQATDSLTTGILVSLLTASPVCYYPAVLIYGLARIRLNFVLKCSTSMSIKYLYSARSRKSNLRRWRVGD